MKKITVLFTMLMAVAFMMSCEKEKKSTVHNNIIVPPREEKVVDTLVHKMNTTENVEVVKWLGNSYKVAVRRHTSDSLSVVTDNNGKRYRNNIIKMKITRADGSVFFEKNFTKSLFDSYVDEAYLSKNVILGLVFNDADASGLHFLGSVGSPDELSEEYIPFIVTISRMGDVSVEKARIEVPGDSVAGIEATV